jgi:hypothetical protein
LVISACKELELVRESGGIVTLTISSGERRSSKEILLEALDIRVLGDRGVEPWFGMFYAFLISRGPGESEAGPGQSGEIWEQKFNAEVLRNARVENRFNSAKYAGFRRWWRYIGLGWHDSKDVFQPNPYGRLARMLPSIFNTDSVLESDEFMQRLARCCPELDGGSLFRDAMCDYDLDRRECTAALAASLVEMNQDGLIELECPVDSQGWSLKKVSPARTSAMPSDRFDRVRFKQKRVPRGPK